MELTISDSLRVLFTARQNVKKMLTLRGCTVMENDWDSTVEDFSSVYQSSPSFSTLTIHAKKDGILTLIFFPLEKKLNVPSVRTMCDYAKEKRCQHFIIVFVDTITPFARQFIANYRLPPNSTHIETFHIGTLQYNLLEHDLVPPHRVLTEDEVKAVEKKFGIVRTKFPKMLLTDPVSKILGLRINQMVEIIRDHPSGFEYTMYRVAGRQITR
jgi:DNA-directed RNA polymerase subunit H (RpoH/RPB5)